MSLPSDRHSTLQKNAAKGAEVFVGGLPRSASEDKIHKVLSACGEIVEIRMMKDPQGNLKGFCFVRFATKEAADKAVREKSGTMIDGKKIGVLPSSQQDTLYFGNLNKAWSTDEFERIVLQVFPDIESVDLAMLKDAKPGQKHRNRGFAFVKFSSHAAAVRAQRVGSQQDFRLGNLQPAVQWAEDQPDTDPEELAKIKIAFVRNLPVEAEENYLKQLFERFGKVEKVVVSKKGSFPVGFVHFMERSDLERAIKEMHEKTVQGPRGGQTHKLQVEVARPMDKNKKRVRENSESNPSIQSHSKLLKEEPGVALANNHNSHVQPEFVSADPYEDAVIALPLAVKERLLRILRLGIATRFDIDVKSLCSLKELPEPIAISVLDQFMLSGASLQNKGAYLTGLISRHLEDRVGLGQSLGGLSKVADNSIKQSNQPFSFSHQVSPPAVGPFASHAHSTAPRSDIYASHYSSPLPDYHYPLTSRTTIGRVDEKPPQFLLQHREKGHDFLLPNHQSLTGPHQSIHNPRIEERNRSNPYDAKPGPELYLSNRSLSGPHLLEERSRSPYEATHGPSIITTSYGRVGLRTEEQYIPPVQTPPVSSSIYGKVGIRNEEQYIPPVQTPPVSSMTSSYGTARDGMNVSSNNITGVADHQAQQPRTQVRFDPFTGEPYKFDPFTGEPIRPESSSRQHQF